MIEKETSFPIIGSKVIDLSPKGIEKTASTNIALPIDFDPELFYVLVRSISAGEYFGCNNNSDYFSEVELRGGYPTFLDAHVFTNHQNKDVANSIGSILRAEWINQMKYVELLLAIDRKVAPNVVRGFEKGYTTDVSMGCRVKYTVCSICGNRARTRAEYCDHVKKQRGVVFPDGRKVFEYNFGPRFHDLSVVLNGADKTAKFIQIITPETFKSAKRVDEKMEKVAMQFETPLLEKVASEEIPCEVRLEDKTRKIDKIADIQKEIIDRLYILALLDRAPDDLANDDTQVLVKSAAMSLGESFKHIRNLGLGTIGIALATNYMQGKRLRGEETNKAENFIADNPGVLPLAYMAWGYPTFVKAKAAFAKNNSLAKQNLAKGMDTLKTTIKNNKFFKSASDLETSEYVDIFNDSSILDEFKEKYAMTDNQINLIKAALMMEISDNQADLSKTGSITEQDVDEFLKFSFDKVVEHIEKEASFIKSFLEMGLSSTGPTVPSGLLAPSAVGIAVDALLLDKLLSNKEQKVEKAKAAGDIVKTKLNNTTIKPKTDINSVKFDEKQF